MTRSQRTQVTLVRQGIQSRDPVMIGWAARKMSALIRCAMSTKAQRELIQIAQDLGVANHPEFII